LFNAEIASIRDRIREALPGEVRLQWWRDVLSGERNSEAQAHPVASAIVEVIERRAMPVAPLIAMCDARVFDLYDDPMPDRTSYEGYAGETASALLQMSTFLIDPDASALSAIASGHAGVAQAVAGHLLMLPLSQARGQLFIPGDLLVATGLDRAAFLNGAESERVANAVRAFAGFGREHLDKARHGPDRSSGFRPPGLSAGRACGIGFRQGRARGRRVSEHLGSLAAMAAAVAALERRSARPDLTVFNDTRFICAENRLAQGFCDALRSVGLSGIVSYR
jgi:phytoene/squalene synthetase